MGLSCTSSCMHMQLPAGCGQGTGVEQKGLLPVLPDTASLVSTQHTAHQKHLSSNPFRCDRQQKLC